MIRIIKGSQDGDQRCLLASMFEDRKALFVDLLGWKVPVVGSRYEIDRYDHDHAVYFIEEDEEGRHQGSLRLLPSDRGHILGDLYRTLCRGPVPKGRFIFEITRLCLPVRHKAAARLEIRNRLISAMVDYALANRIETLTGVVQAPFREQVLAMGWRARALGPLRRLDDMLLGAFRVEIDAETPGLLAANNIFRPLQELVDDYPALRAAAR